MFVNNERVHFLKIVSQDMGDYEISRLNKSLRYVKFEVAMKMFVPVIVDGMNLLHSFKMTKAKYCYEQVKKAIVTIEKYFKAKKEIF